MAAGFGAALDGALAAWREALGAAHVIVGEAERARGERGTFPTRARVPAIVRPGSTADVQAVLRIAQRTGVPVYPVSTGRNWGYGSRVPVEDAVVVDLGRLRAISGFDARMARVTVEPGVTF